MTTQHNYSMLWTFAVALAFLGINTLSTNASATTVTNLKRELLRLHAELRTAKYGVDSAAEAYDATQRELQSIKKELRLVRGQLRINQNLQRQPSTNKTVLSRKRSELKIEKGDLKQQQGKLRKAVVAQERTMRSAKGRTVFLQRQIKVTKEKILWEDEMAKAAKQRSLLKQARKDANNPPLKRKKVTAPPPPPPTVDTSRVSRGNSFDTAGSSSIDELSPSALAGALAGASDSARVAGDSAAEAALDAAEVASAHSRRPSNPVAKTRRGRSAKRETAVMDRTHDASRSARSRSSSHAPVLREGAPVTLEGGDDIGSAVLAAAAEGVYTRLSVKARRSSGASSKHPLRDGAFTGGAVSPDLAEAIGFAPRRGSAGSLEAVADVTDPLDLAGIGVTIRDAAVDEAALRAAGIKPQRRRQIAKIRELMGAAADDDNLLEATAKGSDSSGSVRTGSTASNSPK